MDRDNKCNNSNIQCLSACSSLSMTQKYTNPKKKYSDLIQAKLEIIVFSIFFWIHVFLKKGPIADQVRIIKKKYLKKHKENT